MRGLIADPEAPGRLRPGEAPDLVRGPDQVLVEARHGKIIWTEQHLPWTGLARL